MSKPSPGPKASGRGAARPGRRDRGGDALGRERVLAAEVEEALRRAGRVGLDRHALDEGERVVLHEDPVLERAGLGLVGVADEVVRLGRLAGDGAPLAAGREGRAAATEQARRGDLGDDRLAAHRERLRQSLEAAGRPVVGEARRVDAADPGEQAEVPGPACGTIDVMGGSGSAPAAVAGPGDGVVEPSDDAERVDRRRLNVRGSSSATVNSAAGARSQRPRQGLRNQAARAVAGRLAGRAERALEGGAGLLGAGQPAGDVVADVGHERRSLLRGEQGVERGDAVRLGRRHGQAAADVAEGRLADPADPCLHRVECRQQEVASAPRPVPPRATRPSARRPRPAAPARRRWPDLRVEHGVDRRPLAGEASGATTWRSTARV